MDPAAGINAELVRVILLRLPLRSLFRMKCVSREWNSLVSDPSFAWDYRTVAPPPFAGYVLQADENPAYGQLRFVAASDGFKHPNPVHSFDRKRCRSAPCKVTILASSGGLLLCSKKSHSYFVCEPLTRRWRGLPPPPDRPPSLEVGFLHREDPPLRPRSASSPPIRSYRVVRLFYHSPTAMAVETYSSETGEWMASVVPSHQPYSSFRMWPGNAAVAVGATLHWLAIQFEVLTYDADEGSVGWVKLPPAEDGQMGMSLAVAGGRLSCCYKDKLGFDLWLLEDTAGSGRWEHRHRVQLCNVEGEAWEEDDRCPRDTYVRGFHPEDHRVAVLDGPSKLLEYDLVGGTTRVLRDTNEWQHQVLPYFLPSWYFLGV
uniref:F-box protein At5g03970 n=1 Tax=Anthurium amnicola TaxID=1678845 RepID=A0A1D1Z5P3_9ARAE